MSVRTDSYVRHDASTCVTWLNDSCVWRASFICVPWLIHMCAMTHPYVRDITHIDAWHDSAGWMTWLIHIMRWLIPIHMRDTQLIHMCHLTGLHKWYDTGLFCGDTGLFCGDTGLLCGDTGLFCGDTGLFCGDTQLFSGDTRPFSSESTPSDSELLYLLIWYQTLLRRRAALILWI